MLVTVPDAGNSPAVILVALVIVVLFALIGERGDTEPGRSAGDHTSVLHLLRTLTPEEQSSLRCKHVTHGPSWNVC